LVAIDIHAYGKLERHDVFHFQFKNLPENLIRTDDSIASMHALSKSSNAAQNKQDIKSTFLHNHMTKHTWKGKGRFEQQMDFGNLREKWGNKSISPLPIFPNYTTEVQWKMAFFENVLHLCLHQLVYDKHVGKTNYGFYSNKWSYFAKL
jgi:hypothetical protein